MHALAKKNFRQQVMSIEDPVEIKQEEMLQLQLNEAIKDLAIAWLNFLCAIVRSSPIGEIRVTETARSYSGQSSTGDSFFPPSMPAPWGVRTPVGVGGEEEELRVVLQGICYQRFWYKGSEVSLTLSSNISKPFQSKWKPAKLIHFMKGHIELIRRKAENYRLPSKSMSLRALSQSLQ